MFRLPVQQLIPIQLVSSLSSLVLYMLKYPEVQHRAQQELDALLGDVRLPTLEDQGSLPYLQAVIKEVLRIVPPAPLGERMRHNLCIVHSFVAGVVHLLRTEDVYKNYMLPAGSIVMGKQTSLSSSVDV